MQGGGQKGGRPQQTQQQRFGVVDDGARTRTVATQSVYRESEAQTDPYSPDYVVAPGSVPEALTLTHLAYARGLPASQAEILIIERTRQKRLFESCLPPPTDEFSYMVRARLMEAQEFKDWRLELLKAALGERDANIEEANLEKVERLRRRKNEERDRVLANTQRRRIKVLRKMFKERQRVEEQAGPRGKRDVIGQYADFTSRVYAPLARDGHVPDSNTAKIEVQPADLSSYPGLVQLERSLPTSLLKVRVASEGELLTKGFTKSQVRKDEASGKALPGQPAGGAGLKKFHMRNILERPETPRVKE